METTTSTEQKMASLLDEATNENGNNTGGLVGIQDEPTTAEEQEMVEEIAEALSGEDTSIEGEDDDDDDEEAEMIP